MAKLFFFFSCFFFSFLQWVGLKSVFNSWLSRELLEDLGFEKLVHDVDAKEVARLGCAGAPSPSRGAGPL